MGFVIIPHRGQSCKAPENTYAAFDLALQQGFLAFETDCQLSSCGVPVIIHDEELSRIAGVSHRVGSLTLPELLQLDVGSWFGESSFVGERIPLLSDLLNRYGETCHIHLELKSKQENLPSAVAKTLQESGCLGAGEPYPGRDPFSSPGLTITSFHHSQLVVSKQLLPEVRHGWLVQEITPEVLRMAKEAGIEGVYPRANACQRESISQALETGHSVRGWGVRTIEDLMRLHDNGAQGCTVDWPDRAQQVLQSLT